MILVNGKPVDYSTLPESAQGTMQRYIEHGIPPGSFMEAVLSNDLKQTCERADFFNRYLLFEYVQWLYNYAPQNCFGSCENYRDWLNSFNTKEATL